MFKSSTAFKKFFNQETILGIKGIVFKGIYRLEKGIYILPEIRLELYGVRGCAKRIKTYWKNGQMLLKGHGLLDNIE